MNSKAMQKSGRTGCLLALAGLCLAAGGAAKAQSDGYAIGENKSAPVAGSAIRVGTRAARFEYVSGKVTWRPDDIAAWKKAGNNQSLKQGAEIWVTEGGRAEIRFNDGSLLRLGNDSVVHLETMYSDDKGEYTQIKMLSGLATVLPHQESGVYEVDTPSLSIKASGPARVRVGLGAGVEVGVRQGSAALEGAQGKTTLHAGDLVALADANSPYAVRSLPQQADSWERWNDERDGRKVVVERPVYVDSGPVIVERPVIYERPSPFFFSLDFGGHYGRGYYRGGWGRRW